MDLREIQNLMNAPARLLPQRVLAQYRQFLNDLHRQYLHDVDADLDNYTWRIAQWVLDRTQDPGEFQEIINSYIILPFDQPDILRFTRYLFNLRVERGERLRHFDGRPLLAAFRQPTPIQPIRLRPPRELSQPDRPHIRYLIWEAPESERLAEDVMQTVLRSMYEYAVGLMGNAQAAEFSLSFEVDEDAFADGNRRYFSAGRVFTYRGRNNFNAWMDQVRRVLTNQNDLFLTTSATRINPSDVQYVLRWDQNTFTQVLAAGAKGDSKYTLPKEAQNWNGVVDPRLTPYKEGIPQTDDCLVRCLILGLEKDDVKLYFNQFLFQCSPHLLNDYHSYSWNWYISQPFVFKGLVDRLCEEFDWHPERGPLDLEKACQQFVATFAQYRIVILDNYFKVIDQYWGETYHEQFSTEHDNPKYKNTIALIHRDNHVYYVWSPTKLLSGKYCPGCFIANKKRHQSSELENECKFWFNNLEAITARSKRGRKRKEPDTEPQIKPVKCRDCGDEIGTSSYKSRFDHSKCQILPKEQDNYKNKILGCDYGDGEEPDGNEVAVWVWDIESQLNPVKLSDIRPGLRGPDAEKVVLKHDVNYINVQRLFTPDDQMLEFKSIDDFTEFIFSLLRPSVPTYDHILPPAEKRDHIFIAHNFKSYDGRLLLDCIRQNFPPNISISTTFQGSRLLSLKIHKRRIHFIDSHCHIAKPLRAIPAIFGLEGGLAKGEFPYRFNTKDNEGYVGPIPALEFFDTKRMSKERKREVEEWHADEARKVGNNWNLWDELRKYCVMDVTVLKKCMEAYYRFAIELTDGLNPFRSVTIASYALNVYLSKDLPPDTLYVLSDEVMDFARKALRGGRTDVRRRYVKYTPEDVAWGKFASYFDVQSLYPSVQFFEQMPTGIPEIIKTNTTLGWDPVDMDDYWKGMLIEELMPDSIDDYWCGIIHCDIEPTRYLHHPVLVGREKADGSPVQENESTKLVGSLHPKLGYHCTSVELFYALKKGYKITSVYEIHKYKPSKDLFKTYIRRWLKIKIEASGWKEGGPTWEEFEKHHREVLGIELKKEDMVKNVGKKEVAKLLLNSLWGKLGQSVEQKAYTFTSNDRDAERMKKMVKYGLAMEDASIPRFLPYDGVSGGVWEQTVTVKDPRDLSQSTSVPVACFVSAWGRIKLWEELDKLGDRVLYHDTDSIIFERDPQGYNIPQGHYLGQWEDECKPGEKIVEFVGVAPKTYAYVKQKVDGTLDYSNLRCKGFTLNYENSLKIDFEAMKNLVTDPEFVVKVSDMRFIWLPKFFVMYTDYIEKDMSGNYDKGIITRDFKVLPFGGEKFVPEKYI